MKLELGPEVISSYQRLAYHAWYALAEFVDNSTQSYFNNQATLDRKYREEKTLLKVDIETGGLGAKGYIRITDNSIGMSEAELINAVCIGKPPINRKGRSRYGLGLKTGASWFGDLWTIETKKLGDGYWHKITVDVPKVAAGATDLPHATKPADKNQHFTIVEIRRLHRRMTPRVVRKVTEYLRSLYRRDISKGRMELRVNGNLLSWDANVNARILPLKNGKPAKVNFRFKVGKKTVSGWAGILAKGSRRDAGFSIIQNDRVIEGWPDSYRPEILFGSQVGGTNDLVNQRLFGEVVLDQFEVSHTKDQILFEDGEEEDLEAGLKRKLGGLRELAQSYRAGADERLTEVSDRQKSAALNKLESEIQLDEIQDYLKTLQLPSNGLIRQSNEVVKDAIVRKRQPDLKTKFNKTVVSVYLSKDMSPNDPYVIIEATKSESLVIVIINMSHPHWGRLSQSESVVNFIRHCTYDGIAESKAYFLTGKIEPDTVKLIKDNLLRIPMALRPR